MFSIDCILLAEHLSLLYSGLYSLPPFSLIIVVIRDGGWFCDNPSTDRQNLSPFHWTWASDYCELWNVTKVTLAQIWTFWRLASSFLFFLDSFLTFCVGKKTLKNFRNFAPQQLHSQIKIEKKRHQKDIWMWVLSNAENSSKIQRKAMCIFK